MSDTITVSLNDIRDLVDQCLAVLGLEGRDLEIVRDVLMYAELRGNNQGFSKITERTVAPVASAEPIITMADRGATMCINGNQNLGMVVSVQVAEAAMERATQFGIALVGSFNTSSSTGALGYYAEKLARENMIGICMAGSPKVMAMAGGIDPVFGTNPIAFGVPTNEEPLVLDMATAAIAWFGLIQARDQNQSIPEGLALDASGQVTTDPAEALQGAIKAFGGYKGAGLAMMIEAMTGPLLGAGIVGNEGASGNRGTLFIAIKPSFLGDEFVFKSQMSTMCERIRGGRLAEGYNEILLPGERGRLRAQAALEAGELVLDRTLYEKLVKLSQLPNQFHSG